MINSGINNNDVVSMPIAMAQGMSSVMGQIYPMFAPTIGGIGAFLAGSNTVSNLMLSQFQFETANLLGLSGSLMVAAQSVGAAAGNMVAIHNVVAASATVGLLERRSYNENNNSSYLVLFYPIRINCSNFYSRI